MTTARIGHLDRSELRRAIYFDVTFPTSRKAARCLFDVSRAAGGLAEYRSDITSAEAEVCRMEMLQSQTWSLLSCPNN